MVRVRLTQTSLIIELEGYEKFLALKRRLMLPLESIVKVETENLASLPTVRIGGFSLGKRFYGRFLTKVGRGFFATRDINNAIAIFTKNFPYKVVVVDVFDTEITRKLFEIVSH
jgi:hypothetical protein